MGSIKPESWSNAAYAIAGVYLLTVGALWLGVASILLGVGSFIGHHYRRWDVDWAAMGLFYGTALWYNTGEPLAVVFGIAIGIMQYILYNMRYDDLNYGITGVLWFGAWLQNLDWFTLIVYAVALTCHRIAERDNYQLYHSVWHVLTALGGVYLVV